nr:MAG TPA: hypothetical protein [Caudoviricetes sp.]
MSATIEEATRHQENKAGQAKDRAARQADSRVQVPGGHKARATSAQGKTP